MRWMRKSRRSPIGLDIGRRNVKAVQLIGVRGSWRLGSAAMVPREDPEAPMTPAEIHAVAQVLWRQGFEGHAAVLAAPGEKILGGILEVPPATSGAPADQIARAELASMHRVEPDSFEMAFWELPSGSRGRDGTRVMAAAFPHAAADEHLDIVEAGGLDVIALDTESTASARMCAAVPQGQVALLPLVDLGWSAARLVLLHHGTVIYERRVPELGMGPLWSSLVQHLHVEPPVADFLLKEIGLGEARSADLPQAQEAHATIGGHLDPLVRELHAALGYAEHEYGQVGTPAVQLMGGGAMVPGVPRYLSDLLGLEVQVLAASQRVGSTEGTRRLGETSLLNVAVGLAMHEAGGR